MRLVVDLDGVVWEGEEVLWENVRGLQRLQEAGARLVFVTNNSTLTSEAYAHRLSALGLRIRPEEVVTSGKAAAAWTSRRGVREVMVIGEDGLREELVSVGHELVEEGAEAVVVGLDRRACYERLSRAAGEIRGGALFVLTNRDPTLPSRSRFLAGAGAIAAFLEVSSGRSPDFVAGKPNPWILRTAFGDDALEDLIVVGDRVETDVKLAFNAGARAALVLTGAARMTDEESRRRLERIGVMVVKDLEELAKRLGI
ncbi:MAG: HAD-IIA family hydrolase [Acidilobaceae archaeon]|nr:HAD-IIA family hydrolase [Acidilobaceae archaeon]MCX8165996.1 HAD-IIA family hydrolase [Acidilobaceae archaeon]MDW7974637.1 HAD-IIA family hydrolase [Sulfolobales archaeon]